MEETKIFYVSINCMAYYNSWIEVPKDLSYEEAIEYAKEHIQDIPLGSPLEYVEDSDELDEENCYFADEG